MQLANYRLFLTTLIIAALVVAFKYLFHSFEWEVIVLGSLHGTVVSGVVFVVGFILSATISDYKEAERIPAEIASAIEDMNEDAKSIHINHPTFDLEGYQAQLVIVAKSFAGDLRNSKSNKARTQLYKLGRLNAVMETKGVPANFIVKLKQQQALLARHLFRVNYIQRITFIPSAAVLAWSIVVLAITLLVLTEIEPFVGGMIVSGAITFILIYVLRLIDIIRTPFHHEGKTKDDVSLFLIDRTIKHLQER